MKVLNSFSIKTKTTDRRQWSLRPENMDNATLLRNLQAIKNAAESQQQLMDTTVRHLHQSSSFFFISNLNFHLHHLLPVPQLQEFCWSVCMREVLGFANELDQNQKMCFSNCVVRAVDAERIIAKHMVRRLEEEARKSEERKASANPGL